MRRHAKAGFTLIELLVVIAIIAILAAILFPIFMRAKEQSKITGCQNNLHQIHIALQAYVDDYDGKYPLNGELNLGGVRAKLSDPPPPLQLSAILYTYCGKKKEIWRCPADTLVPRMVGAGFDTTDIKYSMCDYAKFSSSYQWRMGPRADSIAGKSQAGIMELCSQYRIRPSDFAMARDAVPFHKSQGDATMKNWEYNGQASNVLFYDGHVKLTHGTAFTGGI